MENFYFEYFNLGERAVYLNSVGEEGIIGSLNDTLLKEGTFKKFIFLDEIKFFKREKAFLYELKKVKFPLQDIQLDEFIVPFLSFFPLDGERIEFEYEKFYILGSDTLHFIFKRRIKFKKEGKNYGVKMNNSEMMEFLNLREEKRESTYMLLEVQRLPLIIKKGEKIWKRKN